MGWNCPETEKATQGHWHSKNGGNSYARLLWQSVVENSFNSLVLASEFTSIRPNPSEDSSRTPGGRQKVGV